MHPDAVAFIDGNHSVTVPVRARIASDIGTAAILSMFRYSPREGANCIIIEGKKFTPIGLGYSPREGANCIL